MSIEKNRSILLSTSPYRESSILATLFSLQHGRISVIAKGTRRNDRRAVPLDRGYLVEHTLYMKPNRDLHQMTDCSIVEFYPGIRHNLEKTALRDLIFDILLKTLSPSDNNESLFNLLQEYLANLDSAESRSGILLLQTARTLHRIAELLGFYLDVSSCSICGHRFTTGDEPWLSVKDGILRCADCARTAHEGSYSVTAPFIFLLGHEATGVVAAEPPPARGLALLRLLTDFCRYHFDIRQKLTSLGFLYQLYSTEPEPYHNVTEQVNPAPNQTLPFKETKCQTLP